MFTKDERDMMITGLMMRKNYIQTGCVNLSPQDVKNMGPEAAKQQGAKIKALVDSQMELCLATGKLITKLIDM